MDTTQVIIREDLKFKFKLLNGEYAEMKSVHDLNAEFDHECEIIEKKILKKCLRKDFSKVADFREEFNYEPKEIMKSVIMVDGKEYSICCDEDLQEVADKMVVSFNSKEMEVENIEKIWSDTSNENLYLLFLNEDDFVVVKESPETFFGYSLYL